MSALGHIFTARRLALLALLVALALLIWFAGPLVTFAGRAPLIDAGVRGATIGALAAVAALVLLGRVLLARRREARLLRAMAGEAASDPDDEVVAEERAVLDEKMTAAVATLRSRSAARGRDTRFVYELPWYAIIGPPGAGKTTLLANSGLEFPLEESHGKRSVKGVGGTRDCDWWFTDRAVLLDTAGRYTTQDSDARVDGAGWSSFVALLKETRPRRPLNGVLVALSVQDIVGRDDESIEHLAQRLRTRVDELQAELGIVPPLYLVFTKCDLLAGFDTFFADADADERAQVWGVTLPAPGEAGETTLAAELDALLARLQSQTLARLHAERTVPRREAIYTFPLQVATLRHGIGVFAERFDRRSRLIDPILLRGVYLTSATQTGGVLDEVIARVAAGVGLPARHADAAPGEGRAYFVRRLLEDVVFPESGLAGTDPRAERRLARAQVGIAAAVLLGLSALLGLWAYVWFDERARLERVEARAGALERALAALSPDRLDLVETTRALSIARTLADGAPDAGGASRVPTALAGFTSGGSVSRLADDKYAALLVDVLLPRLMTRLEQRLQAESDDDDFLFEGLKTYLMIGTPERFEAATVGGWFRYDTVANLPADTPPATRTELAAHIDALFAAPPARLPRPLDAALIARLREIAASVPSAGRAYARLKGGARDAVERHLALSAIAPELPRLFTLPDALPLDRAVPTLFTVDGYREAFVPAVGDIARRLADERWVLGEGAAAAPGAGTPSGDDAALAAAVRGLYEDEYVATWRALLDGLTLRPLDGLDGAARAVAQLAAADSPLAALLVEAARQTAPVRAFVAGTDAAGTAVAGDEPERDARAVADTAAAARAAELAALLGGRDTGSGAGAPFSGEVRALPADPIAERFAELHALVAGADGGPSPLDGVLAELAGLNAQLLAMTSSPGAAADPVLARELAAGLQALGFRAERLAEPLASVVVELSADIGDAAGSGLCRELESAWQADVLGFWQRALRGRYPLYRKALSDVALADFAAFFGPAGRLQRFVDARLASLVTRTPGQWTWNGGGTSCLSDETLRQLALADDIRDTFFTGGAPGPSFTFDLVPDLIAVAPEITLVQLQVGTSRADYFHGPVSGTTSFTWPDPGGALQAALRVEPVVAGGSSGISTSGPWAILRLFQQGVRARRDGGLQVDYRFSGRAVSLGFATSSFNPLDSRALAGFRAPETL